MIDIKKKLQDEIAMLEYELHVELPKEILKARAHGDLSENAEYHAAKERQGFVNARLNQLRKRLAEISMIDFSQDSARPRRAGFYRGGAGYTATKRSRTIWLPPKRPMRPTERFPPPSPIGRALLGKEVGDAVRVQSPGGVKELEILKLTTIHDVQ